MEKICVVLVTFNRKNLLINLLNALFNQTKEIKSIVIVDNNSNDGTCDLLLKEGIISDYEIGKCVISKYQNMDIHYHLNEENTGGSGGFKKAYEIAMNIDCDYIWTMDDDVLPEYDCLEVLLSYMSETCGICIPNRTTGEFIDQAIISFNWNNPFKSVYLKETINEDKIDKTKLVYDFPFEGPLIKKNIVEKVGLPNSEYFIFFDDSDYALRCLKYTNILFVRESHLHKQIIPIIGDTNYCWRDYYYARNEIIFDRKYNNNRFVATIRPYICLMKRVLKYTVLNDKIALKYSKRAFYDWKNANLGKTVSPGELK